MLNPGPTPFRTTLSLMGGHAAMFGSIAAVFAATEARGIPRTATPASAGHDPPPFLPLPRPASPTPTALRTIDPQHARTIGNRSHDQRPIRCQHCCCRLCCWLYLRCISPDHCAAQSPSPVARLCNAACPPTRRALHSLGERARRRTIPLLLFQWSLHAVGPAGRCSFFSSSQTHRSSLVPARRSPQLQPLRRFRWLSAFWRRSGDG